jgi:hypothetical protein
MPTALGAANGVPCAAGQNVTLFQAVTRCHGRGAAWPARFTAHRPVAGNLRLSAFFLSVYAITFSRAAVDSMMALEPMWFSTMWGVYNFAGMILAALAVIVILCVFLSQP